MNAMWRRSTGVVYVALLAVAANRERDGRALVGADDLLDLVDLPRVVVAGEALTVDGEDHIACMLDDLSRAILDKRPVYPDPSNSAATLRVLDALARSAAEQREMDV